MSPSDACPFCNLSADRVLSADEHGLVVRDAYPLSPGHTLVISRRHVASFFQLDSTERVALLELVDAAKRELDGELRPAGYNIGINDGATAGQTIPHLHIHLIPRYSGDAVDPRGGVRWILPAKAKYWP